MLTGLFHEFRSGHSDRPGCLIHLVEEVAIQSEVDACLGHVRTLPGLYVRCHAHCTYVSTRLYVRCLQVAVILRLGVILQVHRLDLDCCSHEGRPFLLELGLLGL